MKIAGNTRTKIRRDGGGYGFGRDVGRVAIPWESIFRGGADKVEEAFDDLDSVTATSTHLRVKMPSLIRNCAYS